MNYARFINEVGRSRKASLIREMSKKFKPILYNEFILYQA